MENTSIVVWLYALHLFCAILFACCYCLACKKYKPTFAESKCARYFFWNGFIRLFMESFFELAITALVNIRTVDWQTSYRGVKYSNSLTLIILILMGVLVTCLNVLYCRNFSILSEDRFKNRYGSGLEETNLAKKVSPSSILAYPVTFFGRRIIFALSAVYLVHFLWAQLAIMMMISVFMIQYLMLYKPLSSLFLNRMEVLNECVTIILLYGLMCFTDFVPDE